nr:MAG TPA: hypothetical protein [Bacteriophage sp.]
MFASLWDCLENLYNFVADFRTKYFYDYGLCGID